MKLCSLNHRGITLIVSVIILVFLSAVVLGLTIFIVERLRLIDIKKRSISAINSAEGGIHRVVYDFRSRDLTVNGSITLGGPTALGGDNYYTLSASDADLLMVNTSTSTLNNTGRIILGWTIQNATNSRFITIDRMIVTWNNDRRLRRILLNGNTLWVGNLPPPTANVDLNPNFTLNAVPSIYPINANDDNEIRFSRNMIGATVNVQFVMTDGSIKTLSSLTSYPIYPASINYNFTVRSRGDTTGSLIYRQVQAEYNALTGRIVQYSEIAP